MTQDFTGARHPGRARYLFAGQASTGSAALKSAADFKRDALPPWLADPAHLDFLDPTNPFFHTDRALYSFGPHIGGSIPNTMFKAGRGATILGDSGGFQFIGKPSLFRGDRTRNWVLTKLEHGTDEAMTLDIPTAAISATSPWRDFDAALAVTDDNLRFFDQHRAGRTRFLNVLQGRDKREALRWYERVKWFPAGGWAFGGVMRRDWAHLVEMLRRIAGDGLLGPDRNRVHVLGVGDLTGAVMLSAIQRGMQERLADPDFLITFDASSPSLLASKRKAYGYPAFDKNAKAPTVSIWQPVTVRRDGRERVPWPVAHTGIGAHLTWGDLCVPKHGLGRTAWDGLSEALVVHHNVNALLWAIDAANSLLELHPHDASALVPQPVISLYQALRTACLKPDPMSYLRPHKEEQAALLIDVDDAGEEVVP